MALDSLYSALAAVYLAAGVYIYVALLRQIRHRVPGLANPVRGFGWPEAILASLLVLFFLYATAASASRSVSGIQTPDLLQSAVLSIGLLLFIAGFLRVRRLDL